MRITATWNTARLEETKVTITGFDDANRIEQLDFLQDTIGDLMDKYNNTLEQFYEEANRTIATPTANGLRNSASTPDASQAGCG